MGGHPRRGSRVPPLHLGPREVRGLGLCTKTPVPAQGGGAPAPSRAPVLDLEAGGGLAPCQPGSVTTKGCDPLRVVQSGGALNTLIMHPSVRAFEQLYRKLPEQGMFNNQVSPAHPFTFEIGAFKVPEQMAVLLFDLRPDIYRFSGIDAGDYVPVQARRFSSIMGFFVAVNNQVIGNIQFQLDPAPIVITGTQAFAPSPGLSDLTNIPNIGSSSGYANVAGTGNSLTPQRPERYGAPSIPFTLIARSGQVVQIKCVIFQTVPSPIAFIEYDIAGLLIPEIWLDELIEQVKPCNPRLNT